MENISYTIAQITLMTGLTDRTIRNYISSGFLEGDKTDGVWRFTPEQVEAFMLHPAVRPSILAKYNALVYDFLTEDKRQQNEACIILDLPGRSGREISDYFCNAIKNGTFENIRFTFNSVKRTPRVILQGNADDVLKLVNGFYGN